MTEPLVSPERWRELEPLLDAVLELELDQRTAYIDEHCAHDATLHADLSALVRACERGNTILSTPAVEMFAPLLSNLDPDVPPQLGQYTIVRELGRGGMATVFLADDAKHGRQVAVKVLLRTEVASAAGRERFVREIEIAAGLSHPHILPLHDSGETTHAGTSLLYFVSPFVAGESLLHLLRDGRMPPERVIQFGGEIARALDYAHRRGVVHLDIKPGNILLQEGHAVIADFGIARAISHIGDVDKAGAAPALGTPAYMSPEQIAGADDIDGRSDIYSLGCMLYEMVTGVRADTPPPTEPELPHRRFAAAPDPALYAACGSSALASIITRAMAPSRDDRFATAGELAQALADVRLETARRAAQRPRWHPRLVAGSALIGVAAVVLVAYRHQLFAPTFPAPDAALAPIANEKSIGVLPFTNADAKPDQQYFADGLTEDLITLLAKSTDMRVAARAATFKFRDSQLDSREIGRELNVAYLLRGAVHTSGDTLHVSAALMKADDSTTVWSATYDRMLRDVFTVQHEIANKSVQALKTTLLANALTSAAPPRDMNSYNLVLRGRYLMAQPTQESVARAAQYFQEAIRDDGNNAAAYALLARARLEQAGQGWITVAEGSELARDDAQRAIALDPKLADGYEALAFEQSAYEWDWDAAESNYRRALALEPGNAEVLRSAALLMMKLGHYDEAIVGLQKAVLRDPFVATYSALSYALGVAGRWRESEAAARTALALGPNSILRHFNLARALLFQGKNDAALSEVALEKKESWQLMGYAIVYHALGRHVESDRALADYEAKYASHSAMQIAEVHAYRGEVDEAFVWLERARAQNDPGITDLIDDPWLASVRGDPRYTALLKQVRLVM
jgi:serine/threonine-protein kinase